MVQGNKLLQDVILLENNQLRYGKCTSVLCCCTSHHPVCDYFPITYFPVNYFPAQWYVTPWVFFLFVFVCLLICLFAPFCVHFRHSCAWKSQEISKHEKMLNWRSWAVSAWFYPSEYKWVHIVKLIGPMHLIYNNGFMYQHNIAQHPTAGFKHML